MLLGTIFPACFGDYPSEKCRLDFILSENHWPEGKFEVAVSSDKALVRLNRKNLILVGLKKRLLPDPDEKCKSLVGQVKEIAPDPEEEILKMVGQILSW